MFDILNQLSMGVIKTKSLNKDVFFRQMLETSTDVIFVHDRKGNILESNSKVYSFLGYNCSEVSKLKITDIDADVDSMKFNDRLVIIKEEGRACFETEFKTKEGILKPVEIFANYFCVDDVDLFFLSVKDISKRKMAEYGLLKSQEAFRSLVEHSPDLIMRFDREHKHLFVNSASIELLGIPPEEFIGKTHYELNFPEDKCKFWAESIELCFTSKKSNSVEFSIGSSDDTQFFEWRLIPEFSNSGEVLSILAVAREITQRVLYQRGMEEAITTKDKFFSIIAHDLKNPFNALLTFSRLLKDEGLNMSDDVLKEHFDLLLSSSEQAYNLLERLLEWARTQLGKISVNASNISLNTIVETNLQLLKAKSFEKNIRFQFISKSNVFVYADLYMIDNVVRNFITNALKFTNNGGVIIIEILDNEKEVIVKVNDNGIGIPENRIASLFSIDTSFTRVGTNNEMGTGLGLVLCKEFIDMHKGCIWVESIPQEGSEFCFSLPKKENDTKS